MVEGSFTGKVIVIASNGDALSLELGRAFAEAGGTVVVAAPKRGLDMAMVNALQHEGLAILHKEMDDHDPAQSSTLVAHLAERYGHVDVLVNALAFPTGDPAMDNHPGAAENLLVSEWEASVAMVLTASFAWAQAAGRQMLKQGYGVIANLTSVRGLKVVEGQVATSVAHAALVELTKALGVEWAGRGVRVVGVALPLVLGEPGRRTPLRTGVTAQQIAETLLYLTGDEAAYLTAETIVVDGGWNAYQLF